MRALTVFVVAHLAALIAGYSGPTRPAEVTGFTGWPAELDGRPLMEVPLTEREAAMAADFPGRVGRFTDGTHEIVLRWIRFPTRRLHPASDCLRASGWSVTPGPIRVDRLGRQWGAVTASRGVETLELTERIADAAGASYPDASTWYWAALLGKSRGPWWAISEARSRTGSR